MSSLRVPENTLQSEGDERLEDQEERRLGCGMQYNLI